MNQLVQAAPLNVIPMIRPHTPACPNCARPMVLSHKFYARVGGPQLHHFHCTYCKVGLTEAEREGEE